MGDEMITHRIKCSGNDGALSRCSQSLESILPAADQIVGKFLSVSVALGYPVPVRV